MHRGYVKLWRKSMGSSVWADPDLWRTWSCCLMLASHKEMDVLLSKSGTTVKIQPGQFVTGRESFHRDMYPKKRKSNPHPITVWRWLEALKMMGNLHIETHNKYTIISIINWDIYQSNDIQNVQQDVTIVHQSCTNRAPIVHTDKNVKNVKNVKNKEKDSVCFSLPEWFNQNLWDRFLSHRKAVKAPITKQASQSFVDKFKKLKDQGYTPETVISTMEERGWRWFKPEWLNDNKNGSGGNNPTPSYHKRINHD